jgi:bleomycin hydrolase
VHAFRGTKGDTENPGPFDPVVWNVPMNFRDLPGSELSSKKAWLAALTVWTAVFAGSAVAQDIVPSATPVPEVSPPGAAPPPAQPAGYVFSVEKLLDATEVKDQGRTGTCWSFATASFLESELIRTGGPALNLSEMFIVRGIYQAKARNFLLRQGKTSFGEGALAHDYVNSVARFGVVPEEAFSGNRDPESGEHNHSELEAALKGMLEALSKRGALSASWPTAVSGVLDAYIGKAPERFTWQGRSFSPEEFRDYLGLHPENYVNLTSFAHHPFGQPFVLEIPDNFSSGAFLNLPIDDMVSIINRAIDSGYTVAWDGDVSEFSFLTDQGFAVLPPADRSQPWREQPCEEPVIDQAARQVAFESLATTDDHLMHLIGRARDQNGRAYYIVKNSWGPGGKHAGHVYLSESYVRLKTVAILVHRDILEAQERASAAAVPATGSPAAGGTGGR